MHTIFVSRHPGAVEWAKEHGYDDVVVVAQFNHDNHPSPVRVIGTLPVHLAAIVCERGGEYHHLSLSVPPELRGVELSATQMKECGATIEQFVIARIEQFDAWRIHQF